MTDEFLRAPLLSSDRVDHGFGTRASAAPSGLIRVRQVHSANVVVATEAFLPEDTPGDGLVTRLRGVALGIRTADCVPVLLLDPARSAIGALHAGWRGTVKGIIRTGVETMREAFGTDPGSIRAAIGPGIGPCCYVVGEDVAGAFRAAFPWWRTVVAEAGRAEKVRLDLPSAAARACLDAGVRPENIERLSPCTSCDPRFHSYRRDGAGCGRQISYIRLTGP